MSDPTPFTDPLSADGTDPDLSKDDDERAGAERAGADEREAGERDDDPDVLAMRDPGVRHGGFRDGGATTERGTAHDADDAFAELALDDPVAADKARRAAETAQIAADDDGTHETGTGVA